MNLVFNELSLSPEYLARDKEQARQYLEKLLSQIVQYRQATRNNKAAVLLENKSALGSVFFAPSCTLGQSGLDKDKMSLLLNAFTQKPLIQPDQVPEYYYNNQRVFGFGYAAENNLYAISFNATHWNQPQYSLLRVDYEEDINIQVKHLCDQSQFDHPLEHIVNGAQLWERRMDFFPNIVFCGQTQRQLEALSANNILLRTIGEKLLNLNQTIAILKTKYGHFGNFDRVAAECGLTSLAMTESEATLNKYSACRTFLIPETQKNEVFQSHIKGFPEAWRIHFFLHHQLQTCYVGYIGRHLPTVNFN
jgi:hypothetical protein